MLLLTLPILAMGCGKASAVSKNETSGTDKSSVNDDITKCVRIPDPLQPRSEIIYVSDTEVKVLKGGFLSSDIEKYVSPEGMYAEPIEGMRITYADDGYILRIIYPEGVEDPAMKGYYDNVPSADE
jgi:hypothetical protein